MSQFKHLSLQQGANEIVYLDIDVAESGTNVLTLAVLKELNEAIGSIKDQGFKGLVIRSKKAGNFISGATAEVLLGLETPQAIDAYIKLGSQVCRRIRTLPFPSVAVIEGSCANAGWDIALSCRCRINSAQATLEYTDYQQGHYSGFGGITQLVTRLGLTNTLRFLSKGHHTYEQLKAAELIDHCVPSYQVQAVINQFFHTFSSEDKEHLAPCKPHRSNTMVPRQKLLLSLKKADLLLPVTGNSQQAADAIIKTWTEHNISDESYESEAEAAIHLLQSAVTQHCLKQTQLKKQLNANITPLTPSEHRVHIIGCGAMGRYLARLCAQNNFVVTLYDNRNSSLEKLLPELYQYSEQQALADTERQAITDNISLSQDNAALAHADIIIEAIPEGYLAKASLLKDIEDTAKESALLLTCTDCLPLEELTKNMQSPARLALFNPYHPNFKSDVVETSVHQENPQAPLVPAFARALSLTPVHVKSAAGYLGTRLMMAFLNESMLIHQAGTSISAIDKHVLKMGMLHSPFELIDRIGIPECLTISEALADRRGIDVSNLLIEKNEQGLVGKRSGSGFYQYKNGSKQAKLISKLTPANKNLKANAIKQRLLERVINEARACMKDGIVEYEEVLDLVATITTGFPIQYGGPLSYLEKLHQANKTITK
ncbi:hypothetical protein EOL70_13095 [Leucothrix sargassi]|nr:hypothetical protein EOL70_13095 [Leucothrix sargassi]